MGHLSSVTTLNCDSPVLLLGHGGMLWKAWAKTLAESNVAFYSPDRTEFDLTRPASIRSTIGKGFGIVVNAAGFTNVDLCQCQERLATIANGSGVAVLANACANHGSTLIHYSSDHVFSGFSDAPYAPNAKRDPINAYGRSKAVGDAAVMDSGCNYLLIRTSWMYAAWGRNFVRTIAALASERTRIRVVDDQSGRPTNALHLAKMSWDLVRDGASGVYHITDGGHCTRYEWAREIVTIANSRCVVEPCTTAEFPRAAKRPRSSILDLAETEALLGPMPPWQHNLRIALHYQSSEAKLPLENATGTLPIASTPCREGSFVDY